MSETEQDDLQNLVKSPGWARVRTYVLTHWTEQLADHIKGAVGDRDDAVALAKMRQVVAAHKAVEEVIGWPLLRLKQLEQSTQAARLEEDFASRRGGL